MSDCDGPVDLTEEGIVLEASMWFDAKLKAAVDESSDEIRFADDMGFDSVMVGDVVVTSRVRSPERMLVTSIDEAAHTMRVVRGHADTPAQPWGKGTGLRVFRFVDQPAGVESVIDTVESVDGTSSEQLADTLLTFNWTGEQTSMPGCYWFEFKIMKMSGDPPAADWVKRVPLAADGFMINIVDSPTSPA